MLVLQSLRLESRCQVSAWASEGRLSGLEPCQASIQCFHQTCTRDDLSSAKWNRPANPVCGLRDMQVSKRTSLASDFLLGNRLLSLKSTGFAHSRCEKKKQLGVQPQTDMSDLR